MVKSEEVISIIDSLPNTGVLVLNENCGVLYSNHNLARFGLDAHPGNICPHAKNCPNECGECPVNCLGQIICHCKEELNNNEVICHAQKVLWDSQIAFIIYFDFDYIQMSHVRSDLELIRMNRALRRAVDTYTEINCETAQYRRINFVEHDYFGLDDCGDYVSAIEYIIDNKINSEDIEEFSYYFSFDALLAMAKDKNGPPEITVRYRMKDTNQEIWVESRAIFMRDIKPIYIGVIARDVTSEVLKNHDSLTGLLNRSYMENKTQKYLDFHCDAQSAFISIDFNYFKQLNDQFGHPVGDAALVEFSLLLKELNQANCYIGRMGGDEFSLFIKKRKSTEYIRILMRNLEEKLRGLSKKLNIDFDISVSLGVALYPENGRTFKQLYDYADREMYKYKFANHN